MNNNLYDFSNLTGPLKYKLTNDYMFKAFLQRNEKALRGLLCALLRLKSEDIKSIVITNPIVIGETITDKTVILDIRLVLNNDRIVNIEMQVENLGDWPERSLTYLCKNFDQLKRGENYMDTMRVVQIGILDFTPEGFPEQLFLEYYFSNIENTHIYSDKVSIRMLQLNQLGNLDDEARMPDLYHWAQLFRAETWEDICMLAEKNESIKEGIVTLKELSEDEKIQMECEARERLRRDFVSATNYGYKQGRDEGRATGLAEGRATGLAEGRATGIIAMIQVLKELGISREQILKQIEDKFGISNIEANQYMQQMEKG